MSPLNYQTGPVLTVQLTCTVDDYISNFAVVNWLDVERFAAIEDSPPGVEKLGDFLYHYRAGMLLWRH